MLYTIHNNNSFGSLPVLHFSCIKYYEIGKIETIQIKEFCLRRSFLFNF
jgi:hypothetical protein